MLLMDGKSMNTTAHSLRVTEAASCFSNDVCEYFCVRRVRFWESAERTSRQGDVDGVAIITLVSLWELKSVFASERVLEKTPS